MEHLKSYACRGCDIMCTGANDEVTYIFNDSLYCDKCKPQESIKLNVVEKGTIKNEVLLSNCHPGQGAHFIIAPPYYLICLKCKNVYQGNIINISNPKIILHQFLLDALNRNENLPQSRIKLMRNALKAGNPTKKIHEALLETHFYSSKQLLCSAHVQEVDSYSLASLTFHCPLCTDPNKIGLTSMDHIIADSFAKAVKFSTNGFNPDFIDLYFQIWRGFYDPALKNPLIQYKFLLMMKNASEDGQNTNVNGYCICLCCKKRFGFGLDQAVQLHEQRLHEVCVECFLEKKLTQCPIDGEQVVGRLIICRNSDIVNKKEKYCFDESCKCAFSAYNKVYPFKLCCVENFCLPLINKSDISNVIQCPECLDIVRSEIKVNDFLLKKLSFLEVNCRTHYQPIQLFGSKKFSLICSKCKDYNTLKMTKKDHKTDYLENLPNIINFFDSYQDKMASLFIFHIIKYCIPFLSAQKICDTLQELEDIDPTQGKTEALTEIMRFSKLSSLGTFYVQEKWLIDTRVKETIRICSQGLLALRGLIIGNTDDFPLKASIYVGNNLIIEEQLDGKNESVKVLFPNVFKVCDEWTTISVLFTGSGTSVVHGIPFYREKELMHEDTRIFVDSDENLMINGNNVLGGPILGFIFSQLHLNPDEAKIYTLISSSQLQVEIGN